MAWLLRVICGIAAGYQLAAIAACVRHMRRHPPPPASLPPISVIKPVVAMDDAVRQAIASHSRQDYPEFELLVIDAAQAKAPATAANRKVGLLVDGVASAQYDVIVVNDADIAVPREYLRQLAAELEQPNIGLVTCIYRAESTTVAGRWEALGINTDFAPSALVAPLTGVSEFGLGATLAFHRRDLELIGGFEAVADFLADDYQLGAKLHRLGRRNVIASPVVSTSLSAPTWRSVWRHQLRWARTVRLSRPGGYAGLPLTFATLWALAAAAFGLYRTAAALLALRLAMAIVAGRVLLKSRDALRYVYLVPLRDLYSVAIWAAAFTANTVEWGGEELTVDRRGRIIGRRQIRASDAGKTDRPAQTPQSSTPQSPPGPANSASDPIAAGPDMPAPQTPAD